MTERDTVGSTNALNVISSTITDKKKFKKKAKNLEVWGTA
jgi:hypothetical protein